MSVTDNDDSEGNIQLWQAPQQDAHSLQTLRLVLNPPRNEEESGWTLAREDEY